MFNTYLLFFFLGNHYILGLLLLILLFIEQKKDLKYLVQGPGVRKNLSVIESYTRIQFKVMSRTNIIKFVKKHLTAF